MLSSAVPNLTSSRFFSLATFFLSFVFSIFNLNSRSVAVSSAAQFDDERRLFRTEKHVIVS